MNALQKIAVRVLGLDQEYSTWLHTGQEDDMSDIGPDWPDEYRRAMAHPERSAIVMDCISFLREKTASIPMVIERRAGKDDWRPVEESPVADIVRPIISPSLRAMGLWGNAFWRILMTNSNRPYGFTYLHAPLLEPKKNEAGELTHYEYTTPKGKTEDIPADEVLHLRWDTDETFKTSPSPLLPVVRYVNLDSAVTIFSKVGIENGPGGLLIQMKENAQAIYQDEKMLRSMTKRIDTEHTRLRRGKPMVPGFPVELEPFEPEIANLKFLHDLCEERICAIYHFPPAIIGLGTGLEHADTRAAHIVMLKQAWQDGLIPPQDGLAMQITKQVLPRFRLDRRYRLRFDRSKVEALQDDEMKVAQRARYLYMSGIAMRSEARALVTLDVRPEDEIFVEEAKAALALPSGDEPRSLQRPVQRALSDEQQALLEALERVLNEAMRGMARGLQRALDELGRMLSEAYLEEIEEAERAATAGGRAIPDDVDISEVRRLVNRIMDRVDIEEWEREEFGYAWDTGIRQTVTATRDEISATLNVTLGQPDDIMRSLLEQGGIRRGLVDMDQSTRDALFKTLSTEPTVGKHPNEAAKDIAKQVPAGRWKSSETRGRVIARTETKFTQNAASCDAYREAGFTHVVAVDNQIDFDDPDCSARDGEVYTIEEAESIHDHPNGTLSWVPEVEPL